MGDVSETVSSACRCCRAVLDISCVCLIRADRLHNGFGYLHNSNETFRWYGPEAWRTRDNVWTDDYRLKPARIHSAVELEQVIRDS